MRWSHVFWLGAAIALLILGKCSDDQTLEHLRTVFAGAQQ